MQRFRSQTPGWLILVGLALLTSCQPEPPAAVPVPQQSHFILRISTDGALFLDGRPIARRDLSSDAVRLANRAKVDARLAGKAFDSSTGVPGMIDIEAAGELPFSTVYPLVVDCQAVGFRRWSFGLIRDFRDPPEEPLGDPMPSVVIVKSGDELPVELRTLPIWLKADEQGKLARLTLDEREFPSIEALKVEIAEIVADPALRFDRALLRVDESLQYAELLPVFKMLSDLKINQVSAVMGR